MSPVFPPKGLIPPAKRKLLFSNIVSALIEILPESPIPKSTKASTTTTMELPLISKESASI